MASDLQDVPITLGGQQLTIRFSIRAMLLLKKRWGLTTEAEVEERVQKAGLEEFIVILWAALQKHHPEVTEDQVLDWLDEGGSDAMEGVKEALEASQAPKSPQTGQPAQKAASPPPS